MKAGTPRANEQGNIKKMNFKSNANILKPKSTTAETAHKSTNSEELTIESKNASLKVPQTDSDGSTGQKDEEATKARNRIQFKEALKKKISKEKVVPLKNIKTKKVTKCKVRLF